MVYELIEKYLPSLTDTEKQKLCVIADSVINAQFNVTALKSESEIVLLHFLDSLALLESGILDGRKNVIDIGCGGGFPVLPLAVCSPDCDFTANDATEKKLRFVAETAKTAGLTNVSTLHGRAEELSHKTEYRDKYDVAVSRAVAKMSVLCELALPFVATGGVLAAMKGREAQSELAEASNIIKTLGGRYLDTIEYEIPEYNYTHTIILIEKVSPTPKAYPRRYGKIIG